MHAGISGGKRRLPPRPPAGLLPGRGGGEAEGKEPSRGTPRHGERARGSAWGHQVPPAPLPFTRPVPRRCAGFGPAWDTLGRSVAPRVPHPKQCSPSPSAPPWAPEQLGNELAAPDTAAAGAKSASPRHNQSWPPPRASPPAPGEPPRSSLPIKEFPPRVLEENRCLSQGTEPREICGPKSPPGPLREHEAPRRVTPTSPSPAGGCGRTRGGWEQPRARCSRLCALPALAADLGGRQPGYFKPHPAPAEERLSLGACRERPHSPALFAQGLRSLPFPAQTGTWRSYRKILGTGEAPQGPATLPDPHSRQHVPEQSPPPTSGLEEGAPSQRVDLFFNKNTPGPACAACGGRPGGGRGEAGCGAAPPGQAASGERVLGAQPVPGGQANGQARGSPRPRPGLTPSCRRIS